MKKKKVILFKDNSGLFSKDFKNDKTAWIISIVFMVIGVIVITIGAFIQINNTKFMESAVLHTAVISNINSSRDIAGEIQNTVFVTFNVDNVIYEGILDEWNSNMYVGGDTKIYYNQNNPNDFKGGNTKDVGYFLIAFGLIFSVIGGVLTYMVMKNFTKNIKTYLK